MLRRFLGSAILTLVLLAPAHAAMQPWSFDDLIALRLPGEPQVSPDGRWVAYVVAELEPDTSRYQNEIWLTQVATGETRRLTTNAANDDSPHWSADGRSLLFLSDRALEGEKAHGAQVWSLSLAGGEAQPITHAEEGVSRFTVLQDGHTLMILSPEGSTAAGRARDANKDDAWVASEHPGSARVWRIDMASHKGQPVTPEGAFVTGFTVAPDGRRLVYAAQREPGSNGQFDSDLWSVMLPDGAPVALVVRPGMDNRPQYSPDGRWIAFLSSGGHAAAWADNATVCVVPASGGPILDLTPDFDERIGGGNVNTGPVWSGDSRSVLFVSCKRTEVGLFRATLSPRAVVTVPTGIGVNDHPSSDASGRVLAWTHEDPTHSAEVWVWDMTGGAPRPVTDLNPWTRERPSFPAQVVRWAGANGDSVEGQLYLPPTRRGTERVPLLLYVHGGPAANHARYFTPALDMLGIAHYLETGWAVLLPNPRGSAGYGLKWRKANQRDWADRPYLDLMTGVDAMIARGGIKAPAAVAKAAE